MNKSVYFIYHQYYDRDGNNIMIGGVETYLNNLATVFSGIGYNVFLYQFANSNFEKSLDNLVVRGVKTISKKFKNNVKTIMKEIKKVVNDNDIIVFASEEYVCSIKNVKTICLQHGISWDKTENKNYLYSTFKNFIRSIKEYKNTNKADSIVCVDYNYVNWYRAVYKRLDNKKFTVIPNFSNEIKFDKKSSDTINIIFARRFVNHRGTLLFIDVCKKLVNTFDNIKITFAGEGPLEKDVDKLVNEYENINKIKFKQEDSLKVHSNYDIAVVPTISCEGTSLSLIEAMASKCCVVSTFAGGLSNIIIDRYNGIISKPTTCDLFENISRVITDKDLRERLQKVGYETYKYGFSYDLWKEKWIKVIENI